MWVPGCGTSAPAHQSHLHSHFPHHRCSPCKCRTRSDRWTDSHCRWGISSPSHHCSHRSRCAGHTCVMRPSTTLREVNNSQLSPPPKWQVSHFNNKITNVINLSSPSTITHPTNLQQKNNRILSLLPNFLRCWLLPLEMWVERYLNNCIHFSPVDKVTNYNFYNFCVHQIHSSDNETAYGHRKYPV